MDWACYSSAADCRFNGRVFRSVRIGERGMAVRSGETGMILLGSTPTASASAGWHRVPERPDVTRLRSLSRRELDPVEGDPDQIP